MKDFDTGAKIPKLDIQIIDNALAKNFGGKIAITKALTGRAAESRSGSMDAYWCRNGGAIHLRGRDAKSGTSQPFAIIDGDISDQLASQLVAKINGPKPKSKTVKKNPKSNL